jgi:hypothetical protein
VDVTLNWRFVLSFSEHVVVQRLEEQITSTGS